MRVNPLSFYIPNLNSLVDIDLHVNRAKTEFSNLREINHLKKLENGILVYRITDRDRAYQGIVMGVDVNHFFDDSIIHHERTIPAKELNQAKIAEEQDGFSKPILLTHRPIHEVRDLINGYIKNDPLFDAHLSQYNARHQLWAITNKNHISLIKQAYSKVRNSYIVDGHHRTQAIGILNKRGVPIKFGMCAFFDIDNLNILPFHRVIQDGITMSPDVLIDELEKHCKVNTNVQIHLPEEEHSFHVYYRRNLIECKWKKHGLSELSTIEKLDVNLVKKFILKGILKIDNIRTSGRLNYIEGNKSFDEVKKIVDDDPGKMAILLHPIDIEQLIEITSNNMLLPPKSTWFLPRMANGIAAYTFKD